MKIPTIEQATAMLAKAEQMNPGAWVAHSRSAADNAKRIAEKCADMDASAAYVLGLLHDIGRREGVFYIKHIFDGWRYLSGLGFGDAAAICLTHSFPNKDAHSYFGEYDCSPENVTFLEKFLAEREYDDYDRLIQLCDGLSMPQGAVLMDKRLVDVVMRYGFANFMLEKWQAYFDLKNYFDAKANRNIYEFLPNVVENTFGFSQGGSI